ncbi:MAG: AMP-binding protein, partial [Candidatus Woesearchaeota archaeon]
MVSTQNIFDAISEEDTSFWLETCKLLDWETFPESCFRGSFSNPSWFSDGRLNVCYNCVDRHYRNNPNKTALIWAQNDGLYEYISYEKLFSMVNAYAFFLKEKGIQKGDVVAIHNTMTPHSVYAMLACARIGAIHTVIFAGFSGDYVKERVRDSHAKMLLSGYIGFRGDKKIVLHEKVRDITVPVYFFPDKRVSFDGVSTVIDIDLYASQIVEPVSVFSNDPLFVLYTSGSTGKPKGLVHGSGGYLTYVSYTTKVLFQDFVVSTHCCVADLGWITGHSYVVYGPLALGMTSVLFESTPYYPDANRYWKLIEDCKAESFYTAPTALRSAIEKNKKSVPCLEFHLSSSKV